METASYCTAIRCTLYALFGFAVAFSKYLSNWRFAKKKKLTWNVYFNILYILIKFQLDATVCRYLFTAKPLYMFRVSEHPSLGVLKTVTAASGTGHNTGAATSLQRGLIGPCWRKVGVPILWPVPEAAVTVFSTPDDGCCDTRNMYSGFAVNKYLHTVESGWIFINIKLRCTEPWT